MKQLTIYNLLRPRPEPRLSDRSFSGLKMRNCRCCQKRLPTQPCRPSSIYFDRSHGDFVPIGKD